MSSEVAISMVPNISTQIDTIMYSTLMDRIGSYFTATQQECRFRIYQGIDNDYYGHLDLVSLSHNCFNLFALYCEIAKDDYFLENEITQDTGKMPYKNSITEYTPEEQRNIRLEALLYAWDGFLELLKQDPRYEPNFKV